MAAPLEKKKRVVPPLDVDGDDFNSVLGLIESESDRGCILVLGAWLDEALGELLRSLLVQHGQTLKDLFEGPSAALGTFSSRINMAHGLGLIARDEYTALHQIRDLRNAAAHFDKKGQTGAFVVDFGDLSISKQAEALAILERITRARPFTSHA
jgi:hypothetical protein